MAVTFTNDQKKAIEHYGHNIIVSAGAGSGKTAVLSERVLHFVKDENYKLDEFLILTFTKLAAGEMKNRIRLKLEENNCEEAKNVDTSDICNFDSYSFGLLKKYHFKLGLSPNVSIVEEDIIKLKKIEFLDEMLEDLYAKKDERFISLIDKFCFKDDENIRKIILELEKKASSSDDTNLFFDRFSENYFSEKFIESCIKKYESILIDNKAKIIDLLSNLPYERFSKSSKENLHDMVYGALKLFIDNDDYDSMIQGIINAKFSRVTNEEVKEYYSIFKNEFDKIKENINTFPLSKEYIRSVILQNKDYAEILLDIAKKLYDKQMSYKYQKQVFEFEDIAKMVLKLIREDEEVKNSIKYKLKMIMIDEYQDTSSIQEAFIKEIENNNVYMVGDVKQSIYRFRKAESTIFQNKYNEYKNDGKGEAIDLTSNFRSRKEVLEDINLIFSEIMSEELGGANYRKDHVINYGNKDYLSAGEVNHSNHSEVIEYYSDKEEKLTKEECVSIEANIIARDIINKIENKYLVYQFSKNGSYTRPCKLSDFCILMDRGTYFDEYQKVFNQYQIPLSIEKDDDIISNKLVLTLKNVILLLSLVKNNDYSHKILHPILSLARSFIFMKDDKYIFDVSKNKDFYNNDIVEIFKEIINKNKNLSNYELLLKTIFELEIYEKLPRIGEVEKNEQYLDAFLDKFKSMQELDFSLEDFIIYLDKLNEMKLKFTISSTKSEQDSVRLMNIHKSKGLEFNIVYYPGLIFQFNQREASSHSQFSDKYGPIFSKDEGCNYPTQPLNKYDENFADLSEKIRLFYVSLTRAREKMIFLVPRTDKESTLEESKSFYDLFYRFHNENSFDHRIIDIESLNEKDSFLESEKVVINHDELKIHSLDIKSQNISKSRASKDLKLGTSSKVLEFGTKLHFILEIMDFKNPDFSLIKEHKIKEIVEDFLNSEIMKEINKANIYKEYEFFDEEENLMGIIDLMLVYPSHIDIIDYKTKNIQDDAYKAQLKIYSKYISKKFKKDVNTYLYSLLDKKIGDV